MPCYTQREVTVELEAANRDVLMRGLVAAGFNSVTITNDTITATKRGLGLSIAGGKITVTALNDQIAGKTINEVKRAYAAQVVQEASRRFGWTYKATGENTATLGRRY